MVERGGWFSYGFVQFCMLCTATVHVIDPTLPRTKIAQKGLEEHFLVREGFLAGPILVARSNRSGLLLNFLKVQSYYSFFNYIFSQLGFSHRWWPGTNMQAEDLALHMITVDGTCN